VITGNEARNLAMRHVSTPYVSFLDNDTFVDAGWLEGLERCADETGAWLVAPAVLSGRRDSWEIHYAGGSCRIVNEAGARRLEEHNPHIHRPAGVLVEFTRARTEYVEPHCLLARAHALRGIGRFDEKLLAGREHSTLSLQVRAAGGEIWFEPSVVVRYPWPKRYTIADYRLYLPRWSAQWAERSFRGFNEAWQLTDTTIDKIYRRGHLDRRMKGRPARGTDIGPRLRRLGYRARRVLDLVVTPLAVRACDRRRARCAPARVLHAASWESVRTPDRTPHRPESPVR
jgi:hypothetical protein